MHTHSTLKLHCTPRLFHLLLWSKTAILIKFVDERCTIISPCAVTVASEVKVHHLGGFLFCIMCSFVSPRSNPTLCPVGYTSILICCRWRTPLLALSLNSVAIRRSYRLLVPFVHPSSYWLIDKRKQEGVIQHWSTVLSSSPALTIEGFWD
jgi:hypothetical protein